MKVKKILLSEGERKLEVDLSPFITREGDDDIAKPTEEEAVTTAATTAATTTTR